MQYKATSKYIRTSTRKLRLIADAIRGMNALRAQAQLMALPKQAAKPMSVVLASAIANAKSKQAKEEDLLIASIDVMGGPVMKRWHAVSRGQAHGYKKRMTHVSVVLTDDKKLPVETKKESYGTKN